MKRSQMTDGERFLAKTDRQENGCLLWTAATNTKGYPLFKPSGSNRRMRLAHRYWYEIQIGPIPDGMDLDHDCHTRSTCNLRDDCPHRRCVEPTHLVPMTHRENLLRGRGIPAQNAAKTHCKRGHEFLPHLTYTGTHGGRVCYLCRAEYREKRRAEKAAKAVTS